MVVGAGAARILACLPRWLQGPRAQDVAGAIGAELDEIEALALADQLFVATATWGLAWDFAQPDGSVIPTGWERDYGIPVEVADGYPARRARVRAAMRGATPRTAAEFAAWIEAALLPPATCPPSVYQQAGAWAVFKLCDAGWPSNFAAVEALLAQLGPAHIGLYLAPWDRCLGLEVGQLDLMAFVAQDVLEFVEMDGGDCGPVPPEYVLDAIDVTLLDEVHVMPLDVLEAT